MHRHPGHNNPIFPGLSRVFNSNTFRLRSPPRYSIPPGQNVSHTRDCLVGDTLTKSNTRGVGRGAISPRWFGKSVRYSNCTATPKDEKPRETTEIKRGEESKQAKRGETVTRLKYQKKETSRTSNGKTRMEPRRGETQRIHPHHKRRKLTCQAPNRRGYV